MTEGGIGRIIERINPFRRKPSSQVTESSLQTLEPTPIPAPEPPSEPLKPDLDFRPLASKFLHHLTVVADQKGSSPDDIITALSTSPLLNNLDPQEIRQTIDENGGPLTQEASAALSQIMQPKKPGEVRRFLKKWEHDQGQQAQKGVETSPKPANETTSNNDNGQTPRKEEISVPPRKVILARPNSQTPIVDEKDLRRVIEKEGSDIEEDMIVAIVNDLKSGDPLEMIKKYKAELIKFQSPFKGFNAIKKGSKGTLLFKYDNKERAIYIRIGPHTTIFADRNAGGR